MSRKRPVRPSRPRANRPDAIDRFSDQSLHVQIAGEDSVGLTILHRQRRQLLLTRRSHEDFAYVDRELLDPRTSWQAEVHLVAMAPDHWMAQFHPLAASDARFRDDQGPHSQHGFQQRGAEAEQLRLGGDDAGALNPPFDAPLSDGPEPPVEPDLPAEPDLVLRLHQIGRPWRERDMQDVFDIIHAELIGCDAVTVRDHPIPTSRYYELSLAIATAGQLVRHGARLNGLDPRFQRSRALSLDAHEID